jgi:beta-lactamase class A
MLRRTLLAAPLMAMAACGQKTKIDTKIGDGLDVKGLAASISDLAERAAPGVLGVAIGEPQHGDLYVYNGARPFPLQSVFKAPLAAAALAEVDAGRLSLDEVITLRDVDLSPPFSPVADAWPGISEYTVGDLLVHAAGRSDNTAADVLMKRIGGPGVVTAWLTAKGIADFHVDRYERELQPEIVGLASFRAAWKGETAYTTALAAVPDARKREATALYLTDPRDTATPEAMLKWLDALMTNALLSPASTARLLQIMTDSPTGPGRLHAALPAGARLAHKTGAARTVLGVNPASNDAGIYTLANGRRVVVVAFLSGSTLDDDGRDAIIADVGRAAIRALR